MAQWIVRSPVEGYVGISAGVAFSDGVAVVDDAQDSALRYFRRAGYDVRPASPAPTSPASSRAGEVAQPPRNASKAVWVEWVVGQLGDDCRSDIESLSKAQIVKEYG